MSHSPRPLKRIYKTILNNYSFVDLRDFCLFWGLKTIHWYDTINNNMGEMYGEFSKVY